MYLIGGGERREMGIVRDVNGTFLHFYELCIAVITCFSLIFVVSWCICFKINSQQHHATTTNDVVSTFTIIHVQQNGIGIQLLGMPWSKN